MVIEGFEGELIAADTENVIRPLRTFGKPLLDLITCQPYMNHQSSGDSTTWLELLLEVNVSPRASR